MNLGGIWYIIRETPNNFLCGTWVRDGNFFNPIFIIERLGDTNLYNIDYIEDIKDGEVVVSMRGKLSNDIINGFSTYTIGPKERWWVRFDKKYPAKEDYLLASGTENKALNPKQWGGTGFSLGKRYVVTNYHVIENASSIKITGVNGSFYTDYEAKVIATDRSNDLALLQITDLRCPSINSLPYKIKTQQANVGESVFVLGYPLTSTMGEEIKLTTGVVSSRSGFQGDVSLYQISAPIQPGNSGGPLFDNEGNIIGIVCAKHNDAENVGYAIKASYLQNLVESAFSVPFKLPSTNQISTLPLSAKIQKVENYIYQIKCENSHC